MPYQRIEHTADIRLKVWGKTLEELFSDAMQAMSNIIKEVEVESSNIKRNITLKAGDATTLLISFLSEVLLLSHTNKEVYNKVIFVEFSETELKAKIEGVKVNQFDEDIKAVTFHEADVVKNKEEEWETNLVFDI